MGEVFSELLSPDGMTLVRAALVDNYEWFTHAARTRDFKDIQKRKFAAPHPRMRCAKRADASDRRKFGKHSLSTAVSKTATDASREAGTDVQDGDKSRFAAGAERRGLVIWWILARSLREAKSAS